ncbi:Retrovirus-related Pol polyprotein from transposon TNT 1-94 [Sesamum angolense]|uniref:Retrovirus-related Pol polyprotein from transposon TNT 1-94 n=1 Tax=Sesamum angolense TaxID=2727404 RepID=A0AAE1WVI1_9LAMI|nr:Retrovirus-related Pol polyprotein from transposon TNT 1-94 [Sesamum angolense]
MLQQHQDKMPKIGSSSNTLKMELEPHPVATENRGGSHPTFGDPVAVKPPSRLGYEDMVSFALLISGDERTTFHGAITSQEKKEWMDAMEFDMKDIGAATKILRMEIHRDRGSWKLWLSQRGYVEKVLDRLRMSKTKPVSTPLASYFKLSSEQCPMTDREIEDMTHVSYASAVSCLIYHWEAIKWIFRYLKGTVGQGVVFGSQQNDHFVVGYMDFDYAGDLDDRRSTTRYGSYIRKGCSSGATRVVLSHYKPVEPRPTASGENDSKEDEDNLGAISQWCNTLSHQVATKKTVPPRAGKTAPALTGSHTEEEART